MALKEYFGENRYNEILVEILPKCTKVEGAKHWLESCQEFCCNHRW